ncbi:hypothetical protein QCE73_08775 [Caballeronia sp. LZ029]|uniref:hypothetical protein n=1 Tax=Caballeronia sp. LZ029 TaxID=3038564 RepID=UPI0028639DA6|nr:hypothetical protein [Caballeronia sp. LZ029]MDR5743247.1 hypothetical protein [Caballeronia sp. LZ029]
MNKRSHKEQPERWSIAKECRAAGISRKQAHEWMKLARVPDDKWEEVLRTHDMARISAIKKATVGGHGRVAKPSARLLDALLALELQFSTLELGTVSVELTEHQRLALDRVVLSLRDSLLLVQEETKRGA